MFAGTKITVAATAKPGYSFAADPSGEYTITGDRTINAKATANGRTITVNGNATGDKDSAKTDEEVVVTLTPKEATPSLLLIAMLPPRSTPRTGPSPFPPVWRTW